MEFVSAKTLGIALIGYSGRLVILIFHLWVFWVFGILLVTGGYNYMKTRQMTYDWLNNE